MKEEEKRLKEEKDVSLYRKVLMLRHFVFQICEMHKTK